MSSIQKLINSRYAKLHIMWMTLIFNNDQLYACFNISKIVNQLELFCTLSLRNTFYTKVRFELIFKLRLLDFPQNIFNLTKKRLVPLSCPGPTYLYIQRERCMTNNFHDLENFWELKK